MASCFRLSDAAPQKAVVSDGIAAAVPLSAAGGALQPFCLQCDLFSFGPLDTKVQRQQHANANIPAAEMGIQLVTGEAKKKRKELQHLLHVT